MASIGVNWKAEHVSGKEEVGGRSQVGRGEKTF